MRTTGSRTDGQTLSAMRMRAAAAHKLLLRRGDIFGGNRHWRRILVEANGVTARSIAGAVARMLSGALW